MQLFYFDAGYIPYGIEAGDVRVPRVGSSIHDIVHVNLSIPLNFYRRNENLIYVRLDMSKFTL